MFLLLKKNVLLESNKTTNRHILIKHQIPSNRYLMFKT